jgi:hypothetical protein
MSELDFVIYERPVYIFSIKNLTSIETQSLNFQLINLMFYKKPRFIHYHTNTVDDEIMLIVSDDGMDNLDVEYAKPYMQIQIINTNQYIDDIGMVSKISSIFSKNEISILYITTCQSNYIFVEERDYEKSLNCLKTMTDNIQIVN